MWETEFRKQIAELYIQKDKEEYICILHVLKMHSSW